MLFPEEWGSNVRNYANPKLPIFHDFDRNKAEFHNEYFWKKVCENWDEHELWGKVFNTTKEDLKTQLADPNGGLRLLYKGYSWYTKLSDYFGGWNCSLWEATYTNGTGVKANMHDAKYTKSTHRMKDIEFDCRYMGKDKEDYIGFFDNDGKQLGKHRKMHLFDIDVKGKIYFKESDTLSAGNDFTIINTDLATIGIGICYDIRFVELSRIMALNGAEILIFPGAFNLTTGPAHWELLFRSRALDNQVYAIGVAPALDEDASYNSYGHSIAVNPWGEVIEELDYGEELKIVEIDLDEIKRVREEIPVLKNRRVDLYEIKEK
jgi:hypothetical protein